MSDSLSFFGFIFVLNLGGILNRILFAVWVHLWVFVHPILRSFMHAEQVHVSLGKCWSSLLMPVSRLLIFMRSFTFDVVCVSSRHLFFVLW